MLAQWQTSPFFLVTTTMANDKGIQRKLSKICKTGDCKVDIHERNILRISITVVKKLWLKRKLLLSIN